MPTEESKQAAMNSSQRFGPMVEPPWDGLHLDSSSRHVVGKTVVEPKVFSPYKSRQGQVPRKIEVERRKRKFAHVDITEVLNKNGVMI